MTMSFLTFELVVLALVVSSTGVGYWLFGWRGAFAALVLFASVWVTSRVIKSYDADAAEKSLKESEAARKKDSENRAKEAKKYAKKIEELEAARTNSFNQHQKDLANVAQQLANAKKAISDSVKDKPSCDYPDVPVRVWNEGADAVERIRTNNDGAKLP